MALEATALEPWKRTQVDISRGELNAMILDQELEEHFLTSF